MPQAARSVATDGVATDGVADPGSVLLDERQSCSECQGTVKSTTVWSGITSATSGASSATALGSCSAKQPYSAALRCAELHETALGCGEIALEWRGLD